MRKDTQHTQIYQEGFRISSKKYYWKRISLSLGKELALDRRVGSQTSLDEKPIETIGQQKLSKGKAVPRQRPVKIDNNICNTEWEGR